ncbi:MAG: EF-hand domain-containing protein [Desulfobulbaceae bacterium]|nr:EF-hand domain-containing protein [Desulfobulbaceae bacterium]
MSTISSLGSSMGTMMNAMAMQRPDKQQMFGKVDTDGSGAVDQTELASFAEGLSEQTGIEINAEEALSAYDADGDGALSQQEMEAMMGAYMPPPPIMPAAGEESGDTAMNPGSMPPPPDKEEMFNSIDADGSGTIDESELASFVDQLAEDTGIELNAEDALSTYDTDGDGALSQEEMDTMMTASMPSPPPPPPSQVIAAYNQNSGGSDSETISQLLSLLGDSGEEEQSSSYMPLNITA